MDNELLNSLHMLKESIDLDPRVISLNEIEKAMNENEEVMRLAYLKDIAAMEYDDSLKHFKDNDPVVIAKQKALYEAKYNLDSHPLVKEYNKAYQEVRLLYEHINEELFGELLSKHYCKND